MRHLPRMHHPSIFTVSYLFQLSVFSLLAKPFIASVFSHENPLALIKTCIDVWRPRNDGWSSPGELESWTDLTSSEERGRVNERERETYNVIFQKGVWFHPAGIWKGERERAPGILYVNFPLHEKISTRKDYSKNYLRILEELRWKFGGKCRAWFRLNIMRYWGKGLPEHLHILNSGCQSALSLLVHLGEGKTLNEKTRWTKCINLIGEFKPIDCI